MNSATKALAGGVVTFAIGLLLWLFAVDIHTPVITLTKVGVVLMFVGGLELLYGIYLGVVKKK